MNFPRWKSNNCPELCLAFAVFVGDQYITHGTMVDLAAVIGHPKIQKSWSSIFARSWSKLLDRGLTPPLPTPLRGRFVRRSRFLDRGFGQLLPRPLPCPRLPPMPPLAPMPWFQLPRNTLISHAIEKKGCWRNWNDEISCLILDPKRLRKSDRI